MNNEIRYSTITLPIGFTLYETQKNVSPGETQKILTSNKQFEYTSVHLNKDENEFIFTKQNFFCNTCCKRTPAYDHIFEGFTPSAVISPEDAKAWISRQTASITSENEADVLELYEPMKERDAITCPNCGTKLQPFKGDFINLIIDNILNTPSLECAYYENESGMVKNKEIAEFEENEEFGMQFCNHSEDYMYESINFCLETGEVRTVTTLRDSSFVFNYTDCTILATPLAELIDKNAIVKSRLKSLFDEFWKEHCSAPIPFSGNEINSSTLLLLTRYIGYRKSFYKHILMTFEKPYLRENFAKDIDKKLHLKTNNVKLYSELSLPDNEKIREFILKAPEYFLFYDRINKLHKEIGSKALYRFLTENKDSFERLYNTYL